QPTSRGVPVPHILWSETLPLFRARKIGMIIEVMPSRPLHVWREASNGEPQSSKLRSTRHVLTVHSLHRFSGTEHSRTTHDYREHQSPWLTIPIRRVRRPRAQPQLEIARRSSPVARDARRPTRGPCSAPSAQSPLLP